MHMVIAAAGAATKRFDDLIASANAASSERVVELTMPSARVRLGIIGAGAVVAGTAAANRAAAVLGSAVLGAGTALAAETLDRYTSASGSILDGRGDDLVAIVADEHAGTLTVGAGVGNHRLFVADIDGGMLVATQLAPLAAALGSDLELDRSFEDFLLGFGFLPDGRTVYENIAVWSGGTVRTLPDGQPRAITPTPVELPDIDLTDATAVSSALHEAFVGALEQQAGARRRHAVLLGGFDSALVAAGLRRLGHDVDCYTFGFGDATYEQRNAQLLADTIGASHHWVQFSPSVIGDLLGRFDCLINQPGAQPHYQLHTVHACLAIAADGHSHVFTGDGCDAVFLGYPTVNRRARMLARLASIPDPLLRAGTTVFGQPFVERHLGHVSRFSRSMLESLCLDEPTRSHLPTRYLDDIALRRLRPDPQPKQAETVTETRNRLAAPLAGLDPTRRAFQGHALIGQSKAKVEGAVAASGVAQFSPFLHPQLKTLAAALPVEVLRPEGSSASSAGKAVLVAMAREHKLVPESIITMPKQSPSDSPIDSWYAGPLRPLVYELIEGLPFAANRAYVDEILAPKRAEDVFRQKASITHHAFQAIGLLCSYATFTRRAG